MSKIITTEDFIKQMSTINPSIEILGKYIAAKSPIHCRCKKCGFEWDPTPSNLKKGRGCQKCSGTYHRTEEEYIEEVALNNPDTEIIGHYTNLHGRILVRCKNCGNTWSPIAQSLLLGNACKKCSGNKIAAKLRLPHNEVVQRMKAAHPKIRIIGTYVDSKTPVACECTRCGHTWSPIGASLLAQKGCPSCTHQLSMSPIKFAEKIAAISPTIELLGAFSRRKDRIQCRCKKCNHQWAPVADSLLAGCGCPKCADQQRDERIIISRKDHESFVKELEQINPFIEVIGQYLNSTTRIKVKCRRCGNEWVASPPNLLGGYGCANCARSSTSFTEQMILLSFKAALGKDAVVSRARKAIGMELDILIPKLHLAIEPGSWHWHKDKIDIDNTKRNLCLANGIRLVTILDSYDEDSVPDFKDYWVYKYDLRLEKNHKTLKTIISSIFQEYNIDIHFSDNEWKKIEAEAYIKSRKMSTEEFIELMSSLNPSIEVLGEYLASDKTIHCRCKKCGYEWNPIVSVLTYNRSGCPNCAQRRPYSHEEIKKRIEEKHPSLSVLGTCKNTQTHVEVMCKECGYKWPVKPNNLLSGTGCPKCARRKVSEKQRMTDDQFIEKFKKTGNPNIRILGQYYNNKTPIRCQCTVCGYEWAPIPQSLLKGHGCKKCANRQLSITKNKNISRIAMP